jgi:hypothetical protein
VRDAIRANIRHERASTTVTQPSGTKGSATANRDLGMEIMPKPFTLSTFATRVNELISLATA